MRMNVLDGAVKPSGRLGPGLRRDDGGVFLMAALLIMSCTEKAAPTGSGSSVSNKPKRTLDKAPRIPGIGLRKLDADTSELRMSPDGKTATVLVDAAKPRAEGIPPQMRAGALWAVPTGAGKATAVATGVTNMPGSVYFSADSRWLLTLGAFNILNQYGDLYAKDTTAPESEPVKLGSQVSYMLTSPDSRSVAFVEDGVLKLGELPIGPFRQLAGEVTTAEFSPDGEFVYFKRRYSAAGGLLQVKLSDTRATPKKVNDQVGDYVATKNGKVLYLARKTPGTPTFELFIADAKTLDSTRISGDTTLFAVTADGQWLTWLEGLDPTARGGTLWYKKLPAGEPIKLAEGVKDFEFTPDSSTLIYRARFEELQLIGTPLEAQRTEKVGALHLLTLATGADRLIQKRSPNYLLSPDGKYLAYTARIERPEISRHLFLLNLAQGEPVKLQAWLYEYDFTPDSSRLLWRADCIRDGRACNIFMQDVADAGKAPPKVVAKEVYRFKLSGDGKRLLTTYAHTMDEMFDVSVVDLASLQSKTVDQFVTLPVVFGDAAGQQVAYIVGEKGRKGVYEATVESLAAPVAPTP